MLHTKPQGAQSTREPLQLGAEIYGHAGLEADLEVQELALDGLRASGIGSLVLDLADARILRGLLSDLPAGDPVRADMAAALAYKDANRLEAMAGRLSATARRGLLALPGLYGDLAVLDEARRALPSHPLITAALDDLAWLAGHITGTCPEVRIGFDLADMGGYGYYSGTRFAVYAHGAVDALLRGGRYDEVGAVFGRNRPAVGFSADLKAIVGCVRPTPRRQAVRAPWSEDGGMRTAIRRLRDLGETVVCMLPGHEHEGEEFDCDRELVAVGDQWLVRAL